MFVFTTNGRRGTIPRWPFFFFFYSAVLTAGENVEALYRDCDAHSVDAKRAYSDLQSLFPKSGYALALRGEAKFQLGQFPAALDLYRQATKADPKLRGTHAALASVYQALHDDANSRQEMTREQALGEPDCIREPNACAFASGDYEQVLEMTKDLDAEKLYWRGRAARELANAACNALASHPESALSHQRNAELLQARNKFKEAADEWRRALTLEPANPKVQNSLASALFASQDYRGVLYELKELQKLNPQSANLNFFTGDALLETEQPDEAKSYLQRAIAINSKLTPAQTALGFCLVKLGSYREAIPHLKAGVDLDRDGSVLYQLSRAYAATGQRKLAAETMEKYKEKRKRADLNGPAQ